MNSKIKFVFILLIFVEVILLMLILIENGNLEILNPQGTIARQQRDLIYTTIGIMLIVAIPLLVTMYHFAFKYRVKNHNSYDPNAGHGKLIAIISWAIPAIFIAALAIITWNRTHDLDPYKSIQSSIEPVRIQVVALDWKWLFLYPDYGIATINFIQFPQQTPVNFELTADAPMNSFWIPQLSGQIYAMTGMSTRLHVMADAPGDFRGQAAEINGKGFSGMKFIARSSTKKEFDAWVGDVKRSPKILSQEEYEVISAPSENSPVILYSSYQKDLYNKIISKFMNPNNSEEKM